MSNTEFSDHDMGHVVLLPKDESLPRDCLAETEASLPFPSPICCGLSSRMALAAKGISVDPVSGRRRSSAKELAAIPAARDEEEDMRSPILMKETHGTYVDPYDSRYVTQLMYGSKDEADQ